MFTHPAVQEEVMWAERAMHLQAFERARRQGVVEHGLPRGEGLRSWLAGALLAVASWLDRTATQQTAARLTMRGV